MWLNATAVCGNLIKTSIQLLAPNLRLFALCCLQSKLSSTVLIGILTFLVPILGKMSTPPPLPLSPKVATPLAHRKRRHSEMARSGGVDLTGEVHDGNQASNDRQSHGPAKKPSTNGVSTTPPPIIASPPNHEANGTNDLSGRRLEDDELADFDDDADSMLEDILDTAELEPYKADRESRI